MMLQQNITKIQKKEMKGFFKQIINNMDTFGIHAWLFISDLQCFYLNRAIIRNYSKTIGEDNLHVTNRYLEQ